VIQDTSLPPGSPLVRLDNVGKRFDNGTLALAGLDLHVGRHEFVSLLGPSGCGKSTALRIIAGLTPSTTGSIAWGDGFDRAERTGIGFVFQEPTLMPWASVRDNVRIALRLQHRNDAAARKEVDEALAMVGLTGFADAYPRELSGGMKMRVSIARALVTRPQLLLLDEPFAALDEITRLRLNDDLLALWRTQSWTVVFVTHSVYESVYLSNRILVMAARTGRIVAEHTIDAPYPRSEEFRTSLQYNECCRAVSKSLARAMEAR
jgi:NitT/TauT family transport system ATP-binding protein